MAGFLKNIRSGISDMVTVAQAKISPFSVQSTNTDKLKGFVTKRSQSSYQNFARVCRNIKSDPRGRAIPKVLRSIESRQGLDSVVTHSKCLVRAYSTKNPWDDAADTILSKVTDYVKDDSAADSILSKVTDFVTESAAQSLPFVVAETNALFLRGCTVLKQDGCLTLYRRSSTFECVITKPDTPGKMYSLFRQTNEEDTQVVYSNLVSILVPMVNSGSLYIQEDTLQKISDCIRDHPSWNSAHVAANLGFHACLKHKEIKNNMDIACSTHNMTPLMAAITGKQAPATEELLRMGAQLNSVDKHGDSVYHFAVLNCPPVVSLLVDYDKQGIINNLNNKGESALFLACQRKLSEATEILLGAGADPRVAGADCLPIHAAVRSGDLKSVELIINSYPEQANAKDYKTGGTPLHWAEDVDTITALCSMGCELDIANSNGDAPLHVMMGKKKSDCLLALLCHGANCNLLDAQGESVLHKAIKEDNLDLVRQFVVFGADVNQPTASGKKPRHLSAVNRGKNSDDRETILYLLHVSGATRCDTSMSGCNSGCSAEGTVNGTPDQTMASLMKLDEVALLDEQFCATTVHSAMSPSHQGAVIDMIDTPVSRGDRVLCLDGGGIRGLVLIQILMEIEAAVGKPIRECFDWIGGTSTGGILACGIAKGFSLSYMKGMYVRLKDEVFAGSRPYDPVKFEGYLKKELGADTVMSDLKGPKIMVSAALGDRFPVGFHFFRNYERTLQRPDTFQSAKFKEEVPINKQKVWECARSSGAAPSYFKAHGPYLDGGVAANNPTLDVLTEIHEYNMGLKMLGRGDEARPIGCVISLGCGHAPTEEVKNMDVFVPGGLMDVYRSVAGATAIGRMLVDQACRADGRVVDRARAWCSMINVPYYRFSPPLAEDIPMDTHDIRALIDMMWQTHCYSVANRHRLTELSTLLQSRRSAGDMS